MASEPKPNTECRISMMLNIISERRPLKPEEILCVRILSTAFLDLKRTKQPRGKQRAGQAYRWFMGYDKDYVFSFRNICTILFLDRDELRKKATEIYGQNQWPVIT